MIADQTDVLPHLQDAQKHLGVLVKELFVVDINERKIVVGKKLLLQKEVPYGFLGGIGVLLDEAHRILHGAFIDIGDGFAEELAHARLVKLLQTVEQIKVGVVGHAFPIEFEVLRVLGFIHQFTEKQVHQFIEGIFPTGHVVLAQDRGKFVVFFLLIGAAEMPCRSARVYLSLPM